MAATEVNKPGRRKVSERYSSGKQRPSLNALGATTLDTLEDVLKLWSEEMGSLIATSADEATTEKLPHPGSGIDRVQCRAFSPSRLRAISVVCTIAIVVGACALTPDETSVAAANVGVPAASERERLIG